MRQKIVIISQTTPFQAKPRIAAARASNSRQDSYQERHVSSRNGAAIAISAKRLGSQQSQFGHTKKSERITTLQP